MVIISKEGTMQVAARCWLGEYMLQHFLRRAVQSGKHFPDGVWSSEVMLSSLNKPAIVPVKCSGTRTPASVLRKCLAIPRLQQGRAERWCAGTCLKSQHSSADPGVQGQIGLHIETLFQKEKEEKGKRRKRWRNIKR